MTGRGRLPAWRRFGERGAGPDPREGGLHFICCWKEFVLSGCRWTCLDIGDGYKGTS